MEDILINIDSRLGELVSFFTKKSTPTHESLFNSHSVYCVLIPCQEYPFECYFLALAYRHDLPDKDDWEWVKTIESFRKRDEAILRAAEFYKEHKTTNPRIPSLPF